MRDIDYKIIKVSNDGHIPDDMMGRFQRNVEEALSYGWKLKGGIAVSCNAANTITLYQALTKES